MKNPYRSERADFAREITRRAGSSALELAARYALGFLLNLAGLTVAARALGDAAFGTHFALPLLIVNLFQLLSLGVWATLVQRSEEPERALLETGFTLQIGLGLAVAALVASVGALACARQFEDPGAAFACRAAALGGVWTCLRGYGIALAERHLQYRRVATAELLDLTVFNGIVVAGALLGVVHGSVLLAFATRGLPAVLQVLLRERPALGFRLDSAAIRDYRVFGLPFLGFSLLQIVPVHAAPTVASFMLPAPQAALVLSVLGLTYRILEFPRVLLTIAYRLALSAQSKLAVEPEVFARSLRSGVRLLMAVLAPALAGLALLAPLYLEPFFGTDFAMAAPVIAWLAPAFLLNSAWFYLATGISARGNATGMLRYYALYNLVFWLLVAFLVPRHPLLGLPFAELAAMPLGFVLLRGARSGASGTRPQDVLEPTGLVLLVLFAQEALRLALGIHHPILRLTPLALWGILALVCALRYRDVFRALIHLVREPRTF